jgi:hypothetical protein
VSHDIGDQRCAHRLDQELVDDEPLVVPADYPLGLGEDLVEGVAGAELRFDIGNYPVVEADQREVELGDDDVLVIAGIAQERGALTVARHVEASLVADRHSRRSRDLLDEERGPSPVDRGVVEVGRDTGATAIDVVEVEARNAEVSN